jgi:hypothetical protein
MESTPMKRLLIIAVLAASASACVDANRPVQLLGAFPVNATDCKVATDKGELSGGRLNFNYGKQYTVAFKYISPLVAEDDERGNDFYAEEVLLRYESRNPETTFKEESRLIYTVVQPAVAGEIRVDLIGTEASKTLESSIPAPPERMTLLAFVKIKGRLSSGADVETNEVRYPIEIYRGDSCPTGTVPGLDPAAPCATPGQDENPPICKASGG